MAKITAIRDLDDDTFRKFRSIAVEERMKTGEALNMAMKEWVKEREERKKNPDPKNLLKIRPVRVGKRKVRWSEEIDEFLYGLKK